MRGVVILSTALMLVPIAVAGSSESYRYVVSATVDDPLLEGAGSFCENDIPGAPAVGGICRVPVAPGETLRISIVDDVNGPLAFQVDLLGATHDLVFVDLCAPSIAADGSVSFDVPEGCSEMNVFIGQGGVVGTIVIERL